MSNLSNTVRHGSEHLQQVEWPGESSCVPDYRPTSNEDTCAGCGRSVREGDAVQEITPMTLLVMALKWVPSSGATQAQKAAMNAVVTALHHAVNA